MRLDLFLKKTYLVKRREWAKDLCEEGMVRVNGIPRKASHEVQRGDELAFPLFSRSLRVRVLDLPPGNLAKGEQWSCVEILEDRRSPVDDPVWTDPALPRVKPPSSH